MGLSLRNYDSLVSGSMVEPEWMKPFRVHYEPQRRGLWEIKQFNVEMDWANMRLMRDGRGCFPGRYTQLRHDKWGIVMSDTTAEIQDHYLPYRMARGRVLIHGLGLGCFLKAVLSKPSVTHVDVVEIDPDVVGMIWPYFEADKRASIVCDDAMTHKWPSGTRWDIVWHDIWPNICEDNLPSMQQLHRKFGRRCDWQGSWSRNYLEARR